MAKIDLRRLASDIGRDQASSVRPKSSKAMTIIRQNLKAIEVFREQGATWANIAAGLAAQGVMHRDGHPLTGKRLTALIDSIRKQDLRRNAKQNKRLMRADLARAPPRPGGPPLGLASELLAPNEPAVATPTGDTEEAIRRQRYEATKSLFKDKE